MKLLIVTDIRIVFIPLYDYTVFMILLATVYEKIYQSIWFHDLHAIRDIAASIERLTDFSQNIVSLFVSHHSELC